MCKRATKCKCATKRAHNNSEQSHNVWRWRNTRCIGGDSRLSLSAHFFLHYGECSLKIWEKRCTIPWSSSHLCLECLRRHIVLHKIDFSMTFRKAFSVSVDEATASIRYNKDHNYVESSTCLVLSSSQSCTLKGLGINIFSVPLHHHTSNCLDLILVNYGWCKIALNAIRKECRYVFLGGDFQWAPGYI